ncbi:hypothetical protein D7Y41_11835 [Anaerotruncus sp. 1XD22-93]|nr:hypothetical protein D7Y41_11835 [Anaerotruncus sp. 1XD22-93]
MPSPESVTPEENPISNFLQGAFSLAKSPLLPLRGNSPEKSASQDKVFRALRSAAKGAAFGNRDFLKKIE